MTDTISIDKDTINDMENSYFRMFLVDKLESSGESRHLHCTRHLSVSFYLQFFALLLIASTGPYRVFNSHSLLIETVRDHSPARDVSTAIVLLARGFL